MSVGFGQAMLPENTKGLLYMENKTQMRKLYDIARATRTTDEYISYIEYVLQGHSFSARELANKIYKAAMCAYDMQLRSKIDASTGITLIGGYSDAV